jgi:hypothetical protein
LNRKLLISIQVILFSVVFVACSGKKKIENHEKLKHKSSKELVSLLKASEVKGDWLSSKGNIELKFQDNDNSLRFNLRMRIDSATWFSLSKASLPIGSTLISEDSVKFLNKLKKNYYLEDFSAINQLLNTEVDYFLLQDFFLGNAVAFDDEEDYVVQTDDDSYLISSQKSKRIEKLIRKGKIKDEKILYRCWIEPTNFKCKKVIINLLTQETTLEVKYSNWEEIDGEVFPMLSSLYLTTQLDTISMTMDYSKVVFNEEMSMPFKIPSSYDLIDIQNGQE